jgi:hypothetical protein
METLTMMTFRRVLTTMYLLLSIGVTWAAMSQDRVNYPSWALVGPREFGAFHHSVLVGTQTYIIPFALLSFPLGLAMIWLRHPAISRWLVMFTLAVGVLGAITTTQLAIPLQKQMLHGDPANIPMLVGKLIKVDLYWRIIPGVLAMIAYGIMLFQLTDAGDKRGVDR